MIGGFPLQPAQAFERTQDLRFFLEFHQGSQLILDVSPVELISAAEHHSLGVPHIERTKGEEFQVEKILGGASPDVEAGSKGKDCPRG